MFERRSVIIKDGAKLDFDYVPDTVVCRQAQMKEMEKFFAPLANYGSPSSAFLTGGVGTGKTVTAKRFCMDMQRYMQQKGGMMTVIYVNCRLRNSEYAAVLEILRNYDPMFPGRGFSVGQMMVSIRKHIEKDACPVVIILDEADVLLNNNGKDIVYQLSRYSEETKGHTPVSLIMISQTSIAEHLDEASMSSFGRGNRVSFARYTRDELREIIVSRAEMALVPGALPDDCADMLADIAAELGDARYAIESLEKAAVKAEADGDMTIVPDGVRTAGSSVYSDVSENKLRQLDMSRRITLLAIARCMKDKAEITGTAAEKTYRVVCEEYEVPARKHTQFAVYVQDLEKNGLIKTETRREEEGGRALYIGITNIPPRELARKLEYIMETDAEEEDTE